MIAFCTQGGKADEKRDSKRIIGNEKILKIK